MRQAPSLQALAERLAAATGSDRGLDQELGRVLLDGAADDAPRDYTASVDSCIELLHRLLPGWSWHVGWNASGVLPYARIEAGPHQLVEAAGPTVPLALLRALVAAARRAESGGPAAEAAATDAPRDP